jgi:putative pyruvate formate lyase activating enzyme
VFFSGCSLSCVYCQNAKISHGGFGREVSAERLAEIMLELEAKGASNINFVTPTHFAPSIKEAVALAKEKGLRLPIVYNTSSFDTPETLRSLEGVVDVYLADYKYFRKESAKKYSRAENYPEAALLALDEMYRQKPCAEIQNGLMTKGIIIRILLLPHHVAEAKLILSKLYKRYGDGVYFSLMNQYTPSENLPYPINRTVTREEYDSLVDYALKLGIKNAFVQEGGTAKESFIPEFDNEGV